MRSKYIFFIIIIFNCYLKCARGCDCHFNYYHNYHNINIITISSSLLFSITLSVNINIHISIIITITATEFIFTQHIHVFIYLSTYRSNHLSYLILSHLPSGEGVWKSRLGARERVFQQYPGSWGYTGTPYPRSPLPSRPLEGGGGRVSFLKVGF